MIVGYYTQVLSGSISYIPQTPFHKSSTLLEVTHASKQIHFLSRRSSQPNIRGSLYAVTLSQQHQPYKQSLYLKSYRLVANHQPQMQVSLFSQSHTPPAPILQIAPLVIPQSKYPHSPQHRPSTKDSAPSKIFRQTIASATPTPPMPTPPTSPHKIAIQGSPPRDRGAAAAPPRTCCAHILEGGHRVIGGE